MDEHSDYFLDFSRTVWLSCICALIFTILLSLDAYKAFKRRAHWIPGESLVISALFIQLLSFIDNSNLNVNSNDKNLKDDQIYVLIYYPVFHQKRVMICLFISYIFPGVVRSGLKTVWGDIGALVLVVIWHMAYEVYFLVNVIKEEKVRKSSQAPPPPSPSPDFFTYQGWEANRDIRIWFAVCYVTLFTALILLVILLTCAVIAGKSIRKIISQKVPLTLSCCCQEKQECETIENHVLKCWIVSRASQPDYIMARSVFISFAGLLNTVCFGLFLASLVLWWPISDAGLRTLYFIEFMFILIGWIVLLFRWFTAVIYFPRGVRCLFDMEDFWTRSIVDMKKDLDAHLTSGLFSAKRNLERTPLETIVVNLIATFRLHYLLFIMVFLLQKLIVSLSKTCWCLSELAFRMIRPFIMSRENNALLSGLNGSALETDQFYQYKAALDIIKMSGEMASGLWVANLSAFKRTENNMKKGIEIGESTCAKLIVLLGYKAGTVEDESPTSLEEEKHFYEVGKSSWKMRGVSLIHFMMYFYDGTNYDVINDSFEAYSQAWCFMDIVDSLNPEGYLVSLTADTEFDSIKKIWGCVNPSNKNVSKKLLEEKIKSPLKQLMEQCDREERTAAIEHQEDSRDWMAIAAKISLYKLWKTMELKCSSVNAIHNLRCLLANLIADCVGKELDKAVINNCSKWVEEGREKEIFDAAFIAGKAKAVREKIKNWHDVPDQTEVVAGAGHNVCEAEPAKGKGNKVIEVAEGHGQISGRSQAILDIEVAEE